MNCLCCGKKITLNATNSEKNNQWHEKCVHNFFDSKIMPALEISEDDLKKLAIESTGKGLTVPGVQKKLSLHLTQERTPRLTLVNYPTGYILKPQVEEYEKLPEAEYLIMQLAKKTGIQTVPFALVKLQAEQSKYAYITKRIDRNISKKGDVELYAMEDFCQLDRRLTMDKYRGSYERCAKIIQDSVSFISGL